MKGRGALSNPGNRFQLSRVVRHPEFALSEDCAPETQVRLIQARSLITENRSPDVPFDLSINPYAGCEHGCIYCYARPSHAYLDLSPGIDFETRIFAKTNAAEVLERELRKPGYACKVIAIGGNTDGYQPAEKRLRITRRVLEVCRDFNQPVALITKSALIERDIDILAELASRKLVRVAISLTSLDRNLKRTLEPRTAGPYARLKVIRHLSEAGVPVSALIAPLIPRINEPELESLLTAARDHGATSASYILLRLPMEVRELFVEWLEAHFPQRASAVMGLLRQAGGGRDYNPAFGDRMRGSGPIADLIAHRFAACRRRLGLDRDSGPLDTKAFQPPTRTGDQLGLFG
jgi:DNA repair photolyase